MSEPFHLLPEVPQGRPFDEAVRDVVVRFTGSAARFEALQAEVPASAFTEQEWKVVALAARDVEEAVEHAEEGYAAVQYDGNAWYRIIESLEKVHLRLESAIGLMERVRDRLR